MNDNKVYIYIMTNPAFDEVKIGFTKDLTKRRKELSKSTGVPRKFSVYAYYKTRNTKSPDVCVHHIIDQLSADTEIRTEKFGQKSEFFKISPEKAYKLLEDIAYLSGTYNDLHLCNGRGKEIRSKLMRNSINMYIWDKMEDGLVDKELCEQAMQLTDECIKSTWSEEKVDDKQLIDALIFGKSQIWRDKNWAQNYGDAINLILNTYHEKYDHIMEWIEERYGFLD